MKVLIIEDEAPAFRRLQRTLEEISPDVTIVEVIDSVQDSIKWLKHHERPDLIFMDIQLSDGISFEIFEKVEILEPVIFTTAFDEYMLRAFKVNSIDYLLKPIKKEDLEQSLVKFRKINHKEEQPVNIADLLREIRLDDRKYKSRFLVRKGEELYSIETGQITCFQTRHGVVHLHTTDGKTHLIDQTLEELTELLPPDRFYRANRQFIVHYPFIRRVHKYHKGKLLVELTQDPGEQIVVSAERATDFKNWLSN